METMEIVRIGFIFLAYVVGSIPSGVLIGKYYANVDVLEEGSLSMGATNTFRASGKLKYFFWVMVVDAGVKGWLMMFLANSLFKDDWIVYAIFAAALIGHKFSVFLKFKGGKCVATLLGGLAVFVPPIVFFIALGMFFIVMNRTKGIVSLSSIYAIATLLLGGLLFNISWTFAGFALFSAVLISLAHWKNIKKAWRGKENRLALKLGLKEGKISFEYQFIRIEE